MTSSGWPGGGSPYTYTETGAPVTTGTAGYITINGNTGTGTGNIITSPFAVAGNPAKKILEDAEDHAAIHSVARLLGVAVEDRRLDDAVVYAERLVELIKSRLTEQALAKK